MPQDGAVACKPLGLSYGEAAALSFGGTTALDFLRRAKLQRGESVLINGASGAVGAAAVQLARHFGAHVTAVCGTANMAWVRALGASQVIDYTQEDFTQNGQTYHVIMDTVGTANMAWVRALGASQVIDYTQEDFTQNGQTYHVIMDTVGTAPFSRCQASLRDGGRLLLVLAGLADMLHAPWASLTSGKKVIAGPVSVRAEDLPLLAELAATGAFKAVIDRRYRFEQMVEAHRYVDSGRKKGNVVVMLGDED
jgi:NADPH:quinone reductase-like Zn-dependent oxidoreductase